MRRLLIAVLVIAISTLLFPRVEHVSANSENGARIEMISGDRVTFLKIVLPTGDVIIREVKKR